MIVVKVGRGIGAGIVLGGRLHYGEGFGAGEIGHVRVVEDGQVCRCGHLGCLETVASNQAIVRRAQAIARSTPVGTLNVQRIVIAGSAARFGPILLAPIIHEMGQRSLRALASQTCIEISSLGPNIVLLGAAALLLSHELGLPCPRLGDRALLVLYAEFPKPAACIRLHLPDEKKPGIGQSIAATSLRIIKLKVEP